MNYVLKCYLNFTDRNFNRPYLSVIVQIPIRKSFYKIDMNDDVFLDKILKTYDAIKDKRH